MARLMGLDVGSRTVGVAVSDELGWTAQGVEIVRINEDEEQFGIERIAELVLKYDIKGFVLGLPKNMNNSLGLASSRSLKFKKMIEENIIGVKVNLVDERLTTVQATNYLLEASLSRKKRKKVVDGVAASIILDTFLKMKGD